jgi:carbon storage regulator
MLVLTRKTNESVFIAGGIEVMVVQVRGNRVRLGFRAPANVSIQRRERATDAAAHEAALLEHSDATAPVASRAPASRQAAVAARP